MSKCLTDEELEQLATQQAGGPQEDPEATPLLAHVQECQLCRQLLEECRANQTFVESVKTVLVGATGPEGLIKQYIDEAQRGPRLGDAVPGYAILHELHRGTQGVVYRAVQESTGRQVAIKFLREGVHASRSTRKRFEREIELVASLQHPNIIRVFDSGVSSTGHHYYVMDYVHGQPLHRYVWHRKLSLEQTLDLFATVCDAVNYAHQHGVIHRDLKPSNILVDGEGVPRVLDFGLAKPMAETGGTWASLTGEVVGTLPYMSPEQADGGREEVDIRSDVYSLGIILYLVLTGEYPYPVVGPIAEVLNHIAETEPVAPTRMWASKTGGVRHREHAARNGCVIDDDVETIILRSLAKDPGRRYQNVAMLVEDVRRYLAGQPIEAKRDAGLHVLRKSLARYRIAVAATAVGIVLVAALALTIWGMYRKQSYAMEHAEVERHRTMTANSELASTFLELGDLALDRGDPADAAEKYGAALALNQQLAAAHLDNLGYQAKLADTYMRIGDAALALGDIEKAHDYYSRFYNVMRQLAGAVPTHKGYQSHLALSCERLAAVLTGQGRREEGREATREALMIRRAQAEDPRASTPSIAAYARVLLAGLPATERDPEKGLAVAQKAVQASRGREPVVLGLLALAYKQTGDLAKAAETRETALRLLPEGPSASRRALDSVLTDDGQAFWAVQLSEAMEGKIPRKTAE